MRYSLWCMISLLCRDDKTGHLKHMMHVSSSLTQVLSCSLTICKIWNCVHEEDWILQNEPSFQEFHPRTNQFPDIQICKIAPQLSKTTPNVSRKVIITFKCVEIGYSKIHVIPLFFTTLPSHKTPMFMSSPTPSLIIWFTFGSTMVIN